MDAPPTTAPHLPRPIRVIINAHSRLGRESFDDAVAALNAAGVPISQAHAVQSKDETTRLLQAEIDDGAATVIIGGGDGTLSACAGVLVNTSVAMAILPLGTGNTLARSLGIPIDLQEAARTVVTGHVEPMDVGRANGEVFVNSLTLGVSAEIAASLTTDIKKRLGLLAWPVMGARVLSGHRPLHLKVTSAERRFQIRTHQLVVASGRYIAGPIPAAPDASVQDGILRVFVLGGKEPGSLARTALQWLLGRHPHDPETRYFTTRSLRIESLRRPVAMNLDGEEKGGTPADIELLPQALRVVVPRGFEADAV